MDDTPVPSIDMSLVSVHGYDTNMPLDLITSKILEYPMEKRLVTPLTEEAVRGLHIGDDVLLSGTIVTARDIAHKYLIEDGALKDEIYGGVIYHCGPIVRRLEAGYQVISAGPTTSQRMEIYQADIIGRYSIRAVIGKGGMGGRTLSALQSAGAVYLQTVSGAGVYLADRITEVVRVYKLDEFGEADAIWVLKVMDLPAIVTMDSHGRSLHDDILEKSKKRYKAISFIEGGQGGSPLARG